MYRECSLQHPFPVCAGQKYENLIVHAILMPCWWKCMHSLIVCLKPYAYSFCTGIEPLSAAKPCQKFSAVRAATSCSLVPYGPLLPAVAQAPPTMR